MPDQTTPAPAPFPRLTVARVLAARDKLGAALMPGMTWDRAKRRGCPIGVTYMAEGGPCPSEAYPYTAPMIDHLGLPAHYAGGVMYAFAGGRRSWDDIEDEREREQVQMGLEDGRAILAALAAERG